ncbi:hypothetical protein EJ110_NYTH43243 [Nymphaea thermarum]|nr:hypothetical protein EJ110_NYTH43243 [Nymphaea thermarum]
MDIRIGGFFFASSLPFNVARSPYWKDVVTVQDHPSIGMLIQRTLMYNLKENMICMLLTWTLQNLLLLLIFMMRLRRIKKADEYGGTGRGGGRKSVDLASVCRPLGDGSPGQPSGGHPHRSFSFFFSFFWFLPTRGRGTGKGDGGAKWDVGFRPSGRRRPTIRRQPDLRVLSRPADSHPRSWVACRWKTTALLPFGRRAVEATPVTARAVERGSDQWSLGSCEWLSETLVSRVSSPPSERYFTCAALTLEDPAVTFSCTSSDGFRYASASV